MKQIGIDNATHHLYENSGGPWYPVWPSPMLSVAAFIEQAGVVPNIEVNLQDAKFVFREDSFDPVTRIRRGRFYKTHGQRPSQKYTLPHPVYGNYGSISHTYSLNGECERRLFIFEQYLLKGPEKLVAIGASESLWRVLGAEQITTGEYLVTLKARHALGVLPELDPDAIPEVGREKAIETLKTLTDSAYRETPGSIVDRARDAAQWCLGTWWEKIKPDDVPSLHKDLGSLIKEIDNYKNKDKPEVILSAARIIARLHSRGKPNEQKKLSLRPLMEADSEFALAAVGLLLREFKWTK
ncbi:MAG: hypothetical protein M0022_10105 [Desulfobacteraceae bacterium]|nr:hypothetical protein [Desulfobacteraceae bacterium]